ncbi:hypothetical protein BCR36DRAFT_311211 [Piromyces finnis]|uniref:Uncharacterized protein n=1 Tax=Piromyces finnis TaxID=1754191 RepID=A0A1Y1UTZ7_9FUNG|nr:hypothetical protein BCR36DRAFT_311211 [Piromyces finnis]|eukprot:ORX41500.1 hypothetical protein BCR36DRAFT_311211 [Piromyces finnis]
MIQVGKFIKTFLINVLNIVTPQTINISKKIISLLQKFSLKIYIAVKPIFLKELDIMAKWTEKEVNQINIAIKNFLKDLKLKINEYTTLIYQSIVSENKKLHQSYKNKKEFNKEFIHNKNK